jgi:cell division protein ZapA (FtsZ GTPase activity inhibitor)
MSPEDKIRTTVDIFGTTYKMVGPFSQAYMKQIAAYVNENMELIAKSNPRLDTQKVAVLALFSMADEYFQLRSKWDAMENERTHSKQHIEELRKAFELTEEKERGKSNEVLLLMERIEKLEKENVRLNKEAELSSLSWAERVEDWEVKYAMAAEAAKGAQAALQERVSELTSELEAVRQQKEAAAAVERAPEPVRSIASEPSDRQEHAAVDSTLAEKYRKLQEEYNKLQIEFNEWIQLTQSETQ